VKEKKLQPAMQVSFHVLPRSSSANTVLSGQGSIETWLYFLLSTGEMPDNSDEITNRRSLFGCGFPVVSGVSAVARSESLDFIRYDNKLTGC
jgi:hypothetical protein